MISRLITRTKTIRRTSRQFLINSSTKCERFVDKYQIIKKLLVLGTLTNLYFCYNSFVRFSIYNELSTGITDKFEEWNQNQVRNKEMIFELMKEMQSIKTQNVRQDTQNSYRELKQQVPVIKKNKQVNREQQKQEEKRIQKQKGSSFFSFFKENKENKVLKKDQYI